MEERKKETERVGYCRKESKRRRRGGGEEERR